MSDVTRTKMARGTKLHREHVYGQAAAPRTGLLGIEADLEDGKVNADNLATPTAPFTAHFTWPYIDSEIANYHDGVYTLSESPGGVCVPLMLPPLQEHFDAEDPPAVVLDEIVYSFDQRREGAVLAGKWQDVGAGGVDADERSGHMHFDSLSRYDVEIVIWEKTPLIDIPPKTTLYARYPGMQHENYHPHWFPERAVFRMEIDGTTFGVGDGRRNPFTRDGIGLRLNPKKSYMTALLYPNLGSDTPAIGPRDDYAVVNVQLALKMRTEVQSTGWRRRVPTNPVQNQPRINEAATGEIDLNIAQPAAGTPIDADSADGINTAMTALDRKLREKLKGGLSRRCMPPGREALEVDSCYSLITIPLWQNPHNGIVKAATPSVGVQGGNPGRIFGAPRTLPLGNTDTDPAMSRRIVPLPFPIEIHHAFACVNWQKSVMTSQDAQPGLSHDIGLIMGSGMVGDHLSHDQLGRLQFVQKWGDLPGNPVSQSLIDRWTYPFHAAPKLTGVPFNGGIVDENVSWEIYQIPLVYPAGDTGEGWGEDSGKPIFCGSGMGAAAGKLNWPIEGQSRSNLGTGFPAAGAFPTCAGGEQWLEVRWRIVADDPYAQGAAGFTNLTAAQTIIGYQGAYIILCGRRFLTDGR